MDPRSITPLSPLAIALRWTWPLVLYTCYGVGLGVCGLDPRLTPNWMLAVLLLTTGVNACYVSAAIVDGCLARRLIDRATLRFARWYGLVLTSILAVLLWAPLSLLGACLAISAAQTTTFLSGDLPV